jgi:hypothetical protein
MLFEKHFGIELVLSYLKIIFKIKLYFYLSFEFFLTLQVKWITLGATPIQHNLNFKLDNEYGQGGFRFNLLNWV